MEKRRVNRNKIKLILFISIFSLLLALALVVFSFDLDKQNVPDSLNYGSINNLDYQVYLKENDYFKEEYLEKNKQYIASIIDKVKVDFSYKFSASKEANYKYKYKVVGTLTADHRVENTKKNVLNKEYELIAEKEIDLSRAKSFIIDESFDVDYVYYNNYIKNFKQNFVLTISSNFNVKVIIQTIGNNKDYVDEIKDETVMELDIPLSEQTIEIKSKYKEINNSSITNMKDIALIANMPLFAGGMVSLFVSIMTFVLFIYYKITSISRAELYQKDLLKLLRNYDDIVVATNNKIDFNGKNIIEVATFDELVDAQNEFRIPIIHSNVTPHKVDYLYLMQDSNVWLYVFVDREKMRKKQW